MSGGATRLKQWFRPGAAGAIEDVEGQGGSLLAFVGVACLVGVITGLVAASFKLGLLALGRERTRLAQWGAAHGLGGSVLFVLVCAAAAALAGSLVHRIEPHAEGSGIPRVEGILAGRVDFGRWQILPVKFVGGLLAIGIGGLVLGREGPLVQMGGNVAITVGRLLRRSRSEIRLLVAAGAAAGLATAFNAPIAGGVFVLEELLKRFHPRTTLATLACSASGFGAARLLLPDQPDLRIATLAPPHLTEAPWVAVTALLVGLLGVVYNRWLVGALDGAERLPAPVEARAAAVGALVACVALVDPSVVAGGENLTDRALLGGYPLGVVAAVLVVRVVLGVVSYAAGTPGGLFAPQLVVGSHAGLMVGLALVQVGAPFAPQPAALGLVGLVAFFTASVRAPVTGIVLATEMTGTTTILAPLLGAAAVAMLAAEVCRSTPIYEALAERSARANAENRAERGRPPAQADDDA